MCRAFATLRRIKRSGCTSAIVMLACSFTLSAAQRGRTLFLLTGTFLNDAGQTFPVRLYTVNSQHKLHLFREVVPGREGLYEALDDTEGKIYVAFPYNNGASQAPVTVSVIHKGDPSRNDVVMFNPNKWLLWDRVTATAAGGGGESDVLFALTPPLPTDVQPSPAAVPILLRNAELAAIAGNPPDKAPRVARNDWSLYSRLTFYGSPGGPGQYFTPQALAEGGDLVMHLGGKTIVIDQAPPQLAASAAGPRTMWILAANREFLVSIPLGNGRENLAAPTPATIYIHNRQLNIWKELKFAGNMPECRIFGPWLATMVRTGAGPDRGPDTNPGHNDESRRWIKYERPDVREEFGSIDFVFDIPGVFTLDNLMDGTRLTLKTNEEDSEILDVRKDGLVLYRVNDSIFSAQIEGNKLSAPTLLVKDEDVPEVHWAFWSNAEVKTKAEPKTNSAAQPSTGR